MRNEPDNKIKADGNQDYIEADRNYIESLIEEPRPQHTSWKYEASDGGEESDYLETFVEEQRQQYTPWNYVSQGKPIPIYEAKGNAKPLAIMFIIFGILFIAFGIFISVMVCSTTSTRTPYIDGVPQPSTTTIDFTFDAGKFFGPFVPIEIIGIFSLVVGIRYMQVHRARKRKRENTETQNTGDGSSD